LPSLRPKSVAPEIPSPLESPALLFPTSIFLLFVEENERTEEVGSTLRSLCCLLLQYLASEIHLTTTRAKQKPAKPHPEFPLYPHATGRWVVRNGEW
jgi:hypothetical protein